MNLKLTVDSLDDVPEAARALYVEADGKFTLPVDGIEDTKGLKTALEKERNAAAEARKVAKQYEGLGLSPDEIKSLAADRKKAEEEAARKAGDFDAILKQKETGWQTQLEAERTARQIAETSERRAVISTQLMSALTKLGATEEGLDLLPDRLATRIKYEAEGDQRVIRILSADGGTPMAGSAKDGTATFDDLVKEATTKWPSLFKSSGTGGGGKQPERNAGGTGKTITRTAFNALSVADQAATVRGGTRVVD